MAKDYRTAPNHEDTGWPKGVPYIIGNEGCERFSFYGMKAILWVYLVFLYTKEGLETVVSENDASVVVHTFIAGVYALPMVGAIVADRLLGKYHTIIWLSVVYCAGHAVLAIFEGSAPGIYAGLALIAVGSGGIKPCVSAHVGDQFGKGNWFRVQSVFQAFYFIINFGSFFSTLLIPWVKEVYGWSVAFAIPGILMGVATVAFWMGRNVFVHVPAKPGGKLGLLDTASSAMLFMTFGSLFFTGGMSLPVILAVSFGFLVIGLTLFVVRQSIEPDDGFLAVLLYTLYCFFTKREREPLPQAKAEPVRAVGADVADNLSHHPVFGAAVRRFGPEAAEGPLAVLKIISVFFLVSVFWALFDQHASTWIQQAKSMDLSADLPFFGSVTLLPEQIAATNPILVMLLIPVTKFGLYPLLDKLGFETTPLRRMTLGMLIAGTSFVAVAFIQQRIAHMGAGQVPVIWQLIPYTLLTLAEVMVSITGLEFAYTQAPRRMKSTLMGFWLLTVALGNVLAAFVFGSFAAEVQAGTMGLEQFFWIFAAMMSGAGVLFGLRAAFYRYKDYTQ